MTCTPEFVIWLIDRALFYKGLVDLWQRECEQLLRLADEQNKVMWELLQSTKNRKEATS